jgi:hypothetical protein
VSSQYKIAMALLYALLAVWMLAGWRKWDRTFQLLTPVVLASVGGGAVFAFLSLWMQP